MAMITPEQLAANGSEHAEQVKSYSRTYLAKLRRIEQGFCRDCGILPPEQKSNICTLCFDKRTVQNAKSRKRLKDAKCCVRCAGPLELGQAAECKSCMLKKTDYYRGRRKENKLKVIAFFGGKCVECSEADIRTLTVDHLNNDGAIDCAHPTILGKRITSTEWYRRLVGQIDRGEPFGVDLQLLCFNCHAKKDLSPWWIE